MFIVAVTCCVGRATLDYRARSSDFATAPGDPGHVNEGRRRLATVEARLANGARAFWRTTVSTAIRGGAPRAGNSTLLFVHIPKTAGSSMERVLERLCDLRPPLCSRRFMSSEPVPDKATWYPVSLLQSYPENAICDNRRGDLIYGHIPFDTAGAVAHWLARGLPGVAGTPQPSLLQLRAMKPALLAQKANVRRKGKGSPAARKDAQEADAPVSPPRFSHPSSCSFYLFLSFSFSLSLFLSSLRRRSFLW